MLSNTVSKVMLRPVQAMKGAANTSVSSGSKHISKPVTRKPVNKVSRSLVSQEKRLYNTSKMMKWSKEEAKAAESSETAGAEAAGESTETGTPLSSEEATKLRAELSTTKKSLEETVKALQDSKEKLMHSYAERENIRRIANKDVENAKEFGMKGFAMKMFDVIDTLDICLANMPEKVENNPLLESALVGLTSTRKQFAKVMGDYEVTPMEVKPGDKFDANFHNAIFEVQPTHADQKPQTVGVVVKGGWMRKGNLLRPTHVGVIMKSL